MKYGEISAEDFVRVWQASESVAEVCKKTGMTRQTIHARAFHYRRKGIPLKRFRHRPTLLDVAGLAKLAKSLSK